MSDADDKYPTESERRRFVKGIVGSATLAGVGTGATGVVNSATSAPGEGGGSVTYFGPRNTDGPAPRAMPQIPVEIDSEGYLKGFWPEAKEVETEDGRVVTVAETDLGGVTYSSTWFQYCGVETNPNVRPDADHDDYLRYGSSSPYDWQNETFDGDEKVHVEHFDDYESWGNEIGRDGLGKPAKVSWRSQAVEPGDTLPVQLVRSSRVEAMAEESEWLSASTERGFLAVLAKCTHFCCVPAFKAYEDSRKFGAADQIYCQCHQSAYDPFDVVKRSFVARPRPPE